MSIPLSQLTKIFRYYNIIFKTQTKKQKLKTQGGEKIGKLLTWEENVSCIEDWVMLKKPSKTIIIF